MQIIDIIINMDDIRQERPKGTYMKYIGGGAGGLLQGSWNILAKYWCAMKYV